MEESIRKDILTKAGVKVGVLDGKIFRKAVKGSKHRFRKIGELGAWGIDYDIVYEQLPADGKVAIYDSEIDVGYVCEVKDFLESKHILHFKKDTKDHNVQVFVPIEMFKVIEKPYQAKRDNDKLAS